MYIIGSVLIIPAIIFALVAQARVSGAFSRYSQIPSSTGMTGAQLARKILDGNNCNHVTVEKGHGHLTDHYDPRTKKVVLSDDVFGSTSLAALGVAAHECGHAIQHQTHYAPLMLRQIVIRYTGFISKLLMPLILISIIASIFVVNTTIMGMSSERFWFILIVLFCAIYGVSFLINVITLPTEYNASSRAKSILRDILHDDEEREAVSRVLGAAALTYVASLLISAVYFLRFLGLLLLMTGRRR